MPAEYDWNTAKAIVHGGHCDKPFYHKDKKKYANIRLGAIINYK